MVQLLRELGSDALDLLAGECDVEPTDVEGCMACAAWVELLSRENPSEGLRSGQKDSQ